MLKHLRLLAPALFLAGCSMMPGAAATDTPTAATHAEAHTSYNLILIYSLKDGVTPADFETWVRTVDYPSMRGLKRVADFRTHRVERSLMGPEKPAIQYIETFSIPDLDGFTKEDMGGATVQKVMGGFMGFAEAPQFLVVTEIN
jgi:hypothetical protein